jgi:XTP/dITP diphosphohydrolase
MKILFATNNKGKLKEVRNLFENNDIAILSLEDIGFNEEIAETGITFEENAFIKADTVYRKFHLPVIADDSGLEVDHLGGRPGVYSARYAGENVTYEDNNRKLLSELKGFKPPHSARFICCAVYVDDKNRISVNGKLEGEIIKEFKGNNGFGFDPVFKPEGYNITLAEMELTEKNRISHRALAFNLLKSKLQNII